MIKHYDVIKAMKNKYDYAEFSLACINNDLVTLHWVEYVQKIITLDRGIEKYPELKELDAYLKILEDNGNRLFVKYDEEAKPMPKPEKCCGGGEVK